MTRVTNEQLLNAIECNNNLLRRIEEELDNHATRIKLLENHDCDVRGRLKTLEEREREAAIERTKLAGMSAIIGGAIAVLPQLVKLVL